MSNTKPVSPNFGFLAEHDVQLVIFGTLAEKYFYDDPNTCLIKLRQFGELLAQLVAAHVGIYVGDESQIELLRRLRDKRIVIGQVYDLFNRLRLAGNEATHSFSNDQREALSNLKIARSLGIWFHKYTTKQQDFDPGLFIPPPDPKKKTKSLKEELQKLRSELAATRTASELALIKAQQEEQRRISAEELAKEAEVKAQEALNHLASIQANSQTKSPQIIQQTIQQAQKVGESINLDERETRRLIDAQLRDAGWEVDSENLTYAKGTRPKKGKNLAIAEWPTNDGRADYILCVGLMVVAVVEAKRQNKDVYSAIDQAKRYSRGYQIQGNETLPSQPWGEYKIPFVFATNGREFLQQLRTKSGIWFCDVRKSSNIRRPLTTWYSPPGLQDLLTQDLERSQSLLLEEDFNYNLQLRPYQIQAIKKVEAKLADDARELLIAMATGTGKTKTCIALVYRLLKTKRFRRILFLVDRTALGEQTANAFKETRIENLQTFANIFDIKQLGDTAPDRDTKVHIATVQSFVKRILYPNDGTPIPTADQYDCIVVDECHRGYLLDRELSDAELTFRDYNDYISKYRRVLEHFDAVKIGLTATPALHTTQIFGQPVFTYSYREAVIDGWLIDHEPPIRIITALSEDGIAWEMGEEVEYLDPTTGKIDLTNAPDEIKFEVEQFNRSVVTEEFNRVVCKFLAENLDPTFPEKTLIFCVNDNHADMVVDLLKQALENQYGSVEDDAVLKITGAADKPLQLIRRFKNEQNPKIAVTVDLLTTGIDVPAICNLVFIRRVNSRILYEQMLGRATRWCDDINKEVFRIYDAVDLYKAIDKFSSMKPVAVNPSFTFTQLASEISTVDDTTAYTAIVDQFIAKLRCKIKNNSTRSQLKELRLLLDNLGYTERNLQTAWRDATNEDIAASIIGFIRKAALGDALVPYEQRVDRAMRKILSSQNWSPPQRKWLERIGKQLKVETIVDRDSLDLGEFKSQGGGFQRLNKTFNGQLETILVRINEELWGDVG